MAEKIPVWLFVTMDCERVCPHDMSAHGVWGPPNTSFSRDAISRFDDVLSEYGLVGTYFVVPDLAAEHPEVWERLTGRGCELGLHLHPQAFGTWLEWDRPLGGYPAAQGREVLARACDVWAGAFVRRPRVFRAGNFSGDVGLFPVLREAGLVAGSTVLPGRRMTAYAADWRGFPQGAQFRPESRSPAEAFLEAPVSAERDPDVGADGFCNPRHLRVESVLSDDVAFCSGVLRGCLDGPTARPGMPRTIVVMSHNTADFTDRQFEARLRRLVDLIHAEVSARGLEVRNAPLLTFRAAALSAVR